MPTGYRKSIRQKWRKEIHAILADHTRVSAL
jgi:hypothetical protein